MARGVEEVDITPQVTEEIELGELTFAHSALSTRISRVLEDDYFLPAEICFGTISGGLSILVTDTGTTVVIFLDPESSAVAPP